MLEHEADWGESIIQEYNRLMEEAGKREAQQQGNGQAQKENVQTRYSTKAQDQLTEDKYFQRAIDAWDGTSSGGRVNIETIAAATGRMQSTLQAMADEAREASGQ